MSGKPFGEFSVFKPHTDGWGRGRGAGHSRGGGVSKPNQNVRIVYRNSLRPHPAAGDGSEWNPADLSGSLY